MVRVNLKGCQGAWVGALATAPKLNDETDQAVVAAASARPGFWYSVRWFKGDPVYVPFADIERIDAHAPNKKAYRSVELAA